MGALRGGRIWIWLSAMAGSVSILALLGILLLLAGQGMRYFWPHGVYQFELRDGQTVIGERYARYDVPLQQLREAGIKLPQDAPPSLPRYLVKTGNRDFNGQDFLTLLGSDILHTRKPAELMVLERRHNGNAYGYLDGLLENGQPLLGRDARQALRQRIARVHQLTDSIHALQSGTLVPIGHEFEELRLKQLKLVRKNRWGDQEQAQSRAEHIQLEKRYLEARERLAMLELEQRRDSLVLRDMCGERHVIPLYKVLDAWYPNAMTTTDKLRHWGGQVVKFLGGEPRESNTEGGVFPALFGTVLMVILMSIIVMPLGVMAAVYLHEYAARNWLTRLVRVAVINLAGVPSIVYGMFGLGFFVYVLGGTLDQLFYAGALPNPTWGTPGVLWASLTLALLTLPVVIVSTEEGLARIPDALRHGSLALGATRAETLWRVVLPLAAPAMLTGLILAIARAAGETAPLMLVGVVKSVPELPVDGVFPYLHLDRKFMHLGFQIYDGALQSPNVEAARPLVFATAFLLVTLVVGLNLAAMSLRHYLREKYRALSL